MWHSSLDYGFAKLFIAGLLISPQVASASNTFQLAERASSTNEYDVIIYGNTVAALAAAIKIKRLGKTAAIVSPKSTLGGMTTSGLGWTDAKDGSAISGIALEFYQKVYQRYQADSLWVQESRTAYMSKNIWAQPGPAIDVGRKAQWTFEPKVAEAIWEDWVKAGKLVVFRNKAIKRSGGGVIKDGATIKAIVTEDGTVFKGKMFIDAGYEGDLMDVAGVPWSIGRESAQQYSESTAGFRLDGGDEHPTNIDPFRKKGDPKSGFIYGIERYVTNPQALNGQADPLRLQAYNYRLCLTKDNKNRVPFAKPAGYNETNYEILFRYIESGYQGNFFTASPMPNLKTDTNAQGQVSTDLLSGCYNNKTSYPQWSYADRATAAQVHKSWAQGLLYTLANHPRVPASIRNATSVWGYAKDEFVSNGNFPYELYIREGRRMKGIYTMKQSDITNPQTYTKENIVAMGSYTFDVHRVERVVVNGQTFNEGLVHVPNRAPFPIPYAAIIPEAKYATNFLNPVTMSSTHIGFSAIRMEPTYMMMGESAAAAAVMAIQQGVKVQDINRTNNSSAASGGNKETKSRAVGEGEENLGHGFTPSNSFGGLLFSLTWAIYTMFAL